MNTHGVHPHSRYFARVPTRLLAGTQRDAGGVYALWGYGAGVAARASVDFDFFSNASFDPDELARTVPYIKDGERVQVEPNTLTCRVDRGGPVLVSFFGGLDLGQVAEREQVADIRLYIASLLDIAGNKAAVVQKRAEAKDYLDIDARCGTEWTCPPCWRREQWSTAANLIR